MRALRWNWLWYLPLAVVCLFQALFDLVEGIRWSWILFANWTWALLISPAAALWLASTCGSVLIPLHPLMAIPKLFALQKGASRYGLAIFLLGSAAVAVFVSWVIIWGSFPLDSCADGVHLRLLPFIPRPCRPFF